MIFPNIFYTLMLLLLFISTSAPAQETNPHLKFNGSALSASVKGVKLKVVLDGIKREKGIWFKGNDSLLEQEISVEFHNLHFEEGLRRLLDSVSYSCIFDDKQNLIGVYLYGEAVQDRSTGPRPGSPSIPGVAPTPTRASPIRAPRPQR